MSVDIESYLLSQMAVLGKLQPEILDNFQSENIVIVQYNESHAQACTFISSDLLI